MATYRPLTIGARPVVVSFPEWLLHDEVVDWAFRRLCHESGGRCLSYTDASQVVLIVPLAALDDEALLLTLHRLQDEITVWRLATADGAHASRPGYGVSQSARDTKFTRDAGRSPRNRGWRVA